MRSAAASGLVPGERGEGLIMALTVRENIVLPHLHRLSNVWRLDRPPSTGWSTDLMEAVDIRPRDPNRPVRELSGGNQQKVIFARWLAGMPMSCCWTSRPTESTSAPRPRSIA